LKTQKNDHIEIPGNISSQYISALLMIAPALDDGLELALTSEVYSRPYIEMTLSLMNSFGVKGEWNGNIISIAPQPYVSTEYTIEGDWSGASYWYSFISLAPEGSDISLPTLRKDSTQGDIAIASIVEGLGVDTSFESEGVRLRKLTVGKRQLKLDFKNCPDLAQTVMVAAVVKGVELKMTGLESLKIKETDRIAAMQNELAKTGATLSEAGNTWTLLPSGKLPDHVSIETYEDHRMAMAFAPLCMKMNVTIGDPSVVDKSYPSFWREITKLGIHIDEH